MTDPSIAAMGKPVQIPNLRRPRPEPPLAEPSPAAETPAQPPAADPPWKYTVLLTSADRERALDLEAAVVRLAKVRRTKSMRAEVLRAFFALAENDPDLQRRLAEKVAAQLRDGSPS